VILCINIEGGMMKKSLIKFRRLGPVVYARWLCETNGVEFDDKMLELMARHEIESYVQDKLDNPPVETTEEEINPLVQEEVVNPFPADIQQYDSLKVIELKELCKERNLPVYGTKAELILRLKQDDEGITTETGETDGLAEATPDVEPEAPTEEVAASNGSEIDEETTDSEQQEPIIEEE
tara:strand:- start:1407 stop:1946 length:540 start_codon:yes stop_codon:yes gene_type:complete